MLVHAPQAVVLSHLAFEDIGSLQPELEQRGFALRTIDAPTAHFPLDDTRDCDLLIVMGGPIGVYEAKDYPFIKDEIDALRRRLQARRPTLGICLGAQLMVAALGARVYPGTRGPEIGWSPIQPGAHRAPSWFAPLLGKGVSVLHWHGDTFDLPLGAKHLASTELYENQAFAVSDFALGLQFHPEVTETGLERWYVGHSAELRQKGIDLEQLRADTRKYGPTLRKAAQQFWKLWLDYIL
jgi:GMP synthase (glutamine-hydrolysing)